MIPVTLNHFLEEVAAVYGRPLSEKERQGAVEVYHTLGARK